jgi:hypothetical protein
VTAVMRGNAKTMEPLKQARYDKAPTMTAVEDFTSYAEIADAHADGIKRFVPVFTALDVQRREVTTSRTGKMLLAVALASTLGGLCVGPALADDRDRRQEQQNRAWHRQQ